MPTTLGRPRNLSFTCFVDVSKLELFPAFVQFQVLYHSFDGYRQFDATSNVMVDKVRGHAEKHLEESVLHIPVPEGQSEPIRNETNEPLIRDLLLSYVAVHRPSQVVLVSLVVL